MKIPKTILTTTMAAVLTACGGGGGGGVSGSTGGDSTTPVANGSQITGIAAIGRWMAQNTPVVAIDRNGKTANGSVNATGQYSIDWSGLTFPVLLKATENGISLYSLAVSSTEATGKVNINQLTHMAVVGLLGNGTPAEIESQFKAADPATKLTAELLKESALNGMSKLSDDVLLKTGLTRSSLRDVRTLSDFQVNVREDKLLDQLTPSMSAGKVTLTGVPNIPTFSDAVASTASNFPSLSSFSWCSNTTDTVVYTTKDTVIYGVNAVTNAEKLLAARTTQRALDEIKAQLKITVPGSGIGIDGTNKIAVCIDGTHSKDAQGSLRDINTSSLATALNSGGSISDWTKTLKHEMVHTVQAGLLNTQHQNTVLPLWFTEGMATYIADQEILDTVDIMAKWSIAMNSCVPTTVNYYGQTTTCPITNFGTIYRGYGAVFAALFDTADFGGGGNPLSKLRDMHFALQESKGLWAEGTAQIAFQAAFDALGLKSPSGATLTLSSIQTDSGWKSMVTPYFVHNTINFTVNGVTNLQGMAVTLANDADTSVGFTDVVANNSGKLNLRRAFGDLNFFVQNGATPYQAPNVFRWNGVDKSINFTFDSNWKAVSLN
jgi:hypothetical protein